jgi:phospholipid/cholesterol/gamma-HCH transport system ATP-binding protein
MKEERSPVSSTVVSLRGVTLRLGNLDVLQNVSVDFPAKRSTVVVGPSGCGKSTLLKVAAGILLPDEGEVLWNGRPLHRLGRREMMDLRRDTGFVFQDAALWANKSLAENLILPLKVHHPLLSAPETAAIVESSCRELGFDDPLSSRPAELSVGEQKIVSFLRAVVSDPSLLFVDDPTASVDHAVVDRMLAAIKRMKDAGVTLIVATHSSKLASLVADYVVVLKGGKLLEAGPTAEVVRSSRRDVLEILSEILAEAAVYDRDLLDLLGQSP